MNVKRNKDNQKIIIFLNDTKCILDIVIHDKNLIKYDNELFKKAYSVVKKSFEKAESILKTADIRNNLEINGLTGAQLELKILLFNRAYQLWKNTNIMKHLINLLKYLNIILGSLVNVIPLLEQLKEFKDCLELTIEETDAQTETQPIVNNSIKHRKSKNID